MEIREWFGIVSFVVQVVQAHEFHSARLLSNLRFVSRHEFSDLFGGLRLRVMCLMYKGRFQAVRSLSCISVSFPRCGVSVFFSTKSHRLICLKGLKSLIYLFNPCAKL